ncbi:hypothetical protein Pmar_PMAR029653 [Perkinsus marinus ATCC 50983]|uniref:Tyr recombinase domain-containing protein n=1 Tax=Perkinsus marinus (strain ATCC 50983 / TXsc) TaxID=423536 RepID=C5KX25_PERM5|nr:hypothetical protein Pmar_PMAR029653 [Perkinsus marinus ATCC 50983]EER11029.1 hypothetical protein Pmar_PMAR029653 [Perkinsus marinus ATCC 50983]|eukprot:XP_002779234.1 hypothetical protein Pmar_PMAR029653 [Perkinsus marinus ATCC 50983]
MNGERLQTFIRALLSFDDPQLTYETICKYVSGVQTFSQIRGEAKLTETDRQHVKRALDAVKRIREGQGRKRKQAPVMDDELIDSLIRMPTVLGSDNEQIKTLTLFTVATVCRLDGTHGLNGNDIELIETPGKLRLKIKLMNPKTEDGPTYKEIDCDDHWEMQGKQQDACGVKWCAAHEIARRKIALKNNRFRLFPKIQKNRYARKLRALVDSQFPGMGDRWSIQNVTGHGLRRTGSTLLKLCDVPEKEVQAAGKWKSDA